MKKPPPPTVLVERRAVPQPESQRFIWTIGNRVALVAGLMGVCIAIVLGMTAVQAFTCGEVFRQDYVRGCEDMDTLGYLAALISGFGAFVAILAVTFMQRNRTGHWA